MQLGKYVLNLKCLKSYPVLLFCNIDAKLNAFIHCIIDSLVSAAK